MEENVLTNYLKSKPTFLRISEEIELIALMMKLPIDWLKQNETSFISTIEILSDSHTIGSSYLEETEEDDEFFLEFCEWLRNIEEEAGIKVLRYIDSFSPRTLKLDDFRRDKSISAKKTS